MKCICGRCPVQTKSQCSKIKMDKLMQTMKDNPGNKAMAMPEDVPGLYCSGGVAACTDMDLKQMCICGSCPIWEEYKLSGAMPSMYFCRDGEAK